MGGGWIIEFKKVFVKCLVLSCKRKHYAKGYCERHYHQFCRSKYPFTLNEYLNFKVSSRLKKIAKNKIEKKADIIIKNKTARNLYQEIKEADINMFRYKDIENLTGWKYEKVKKYILLLVKLHKNISIGKHSGGKQAVFKISV